jgi:hypothetical protein
VSTAFKRTIQFLKGEFFEDIRVLNLGKCSLFKDFSHFKEVNVVEVRSEV